ncbi:hypothetical protein SD81_009825 [Tolypothrix campylonemoides VB511288]|nr:hypothetical protein SD81_009825 [Tolypothrix campylonemoides VB511288]
MVKRIQIIGEHRVSISDERGSGRFCREVLALANQHLSNKASIWDCGFAIKVSAISSKEQTSSPQLENQQISTPHDLHSKQAGIIFSAWQSAKQNLAAILATFTGHSSASTLVVEFLQIQMWVETPLSCTNNLGLQSI